MLLLLVGNGNQLITPTQRSCKMTGVPRNAFSGNFLYYRNLRKGDRSETVSHFFSFRFQDVAEQA